MNTREAADVASQARGDGAWRIVTRHGQTIGIVERETRIGHTGRAHRIHLRGARFASQSIEAAIFLAALHFHSAAALSDTEYAAFIRGASLIPIREDRP